MIDPVQFRNAVVDCGMHFFVGVPDSLLKGFCAAVESHASPGDHIVAANEGNAVALAAGHYLATGRPALVYMQNSGLGNAVNPLLSLAAPEVFGIPMVLLVGWRGEPGTKDEPQHIKQGAVTLALCEALSLPHWIMPTEICAAVGCLRAAIASAISGGCPVALIVRGNTFAECENMSTGHSMYSLSRESAIRCVISSLPSDVLVFATTGHISRELFENRAAMGQPHAMDFLTVGSMGHSCQIAMAVALRCPNRTVVCLDGDGALLMHMGSLAIAGTSRLKNLIHVLLNNGAHDSVGGQRTVGLDVRFDAIARACGYRTACCEQDLDALRAAVLAVTTREGPHFVEVRVAPGARKGLGRPTITPQENRKSFMALCRRDASAGS